jgi:hypothetical protein
VCLVLVQGCATKNWLEVSERGAAPGANAIFTIEGRDAGADYGLRLVGDYRNGVDDLQGRYLTEFGARWPGLATNTAVVINGDTAEHVRLPIAGHDAFMLGVNSDVGPNPTVVLQTTNTGPLIKGYRRVPETDGAPVPIFAVEATGQMFSAALAPSRILASDASQNITAPYVLDPDPTLSANLNTNLVSQAAVKAYVDAAVSRSIRGINNVNGPRGTIDDDTFIVHVQHTAVAPVTLTLGSAQCGGTDDDGRQLVIKDAGGSASANPITIETEGAEKIDGEDTRVLDSNYSSMRIYCYAGHWFVSHLNRGGESGGGAGSGR